MEGTKHYTAEIVIVILENIAIAIKYLLSYIGVPLAVFCFKASGWGTATLDVLTRISFGVGVGLLTAFCVTVYKALLEDKIIAYLKEKKKEWMQKKNPQSSEEGKSEAQE